MQNTDDGGSPARRADITITNGLYVYRDVQIPLYSGEWSYWAVMRENWQAVARSIKQMGVEVVSSYIPWSHHELSPGEYDWEGRTSPQRDLIGFIELCREEGLYLILRPGPYIYAGWPGGGPPERVGYFKYDRLSPEFLDEGERYIRAICRDVLAARQITRGGNLIILQADNEPFPAIEMRGDEIGCFKQPGIFKEWLARKYDGDIERLNRRWKTTLSGFDEACVYFHEVCADTERPMAERLLPAPEYHMRYADSFEYIGWHAAEIVRVTGAWMRDSGIDIPIAANSWSPLYADFGKFCEVADIAGMDIYPSPNFQLTISPKDQRPYPVKDNWLYNVDIVKMTEANVTNGNVWSAEFQAGIYPIQHCGYFPPGHFRFMSLALLARGLKVWNWYLLVTQYNWPCSPINEWGWANDYYPVHQETLAVTRRVEPWNLTPLYDVGMVVSKPHRVIDPGNFEAVYQALESANISYAYVDLHSSRPIEQDTLVYEGADWLAADDLARLEAFVEGGGTLITFSRAPFRDEYGAPTRLPFSPIEGARPVLLPVTVAYRNDQVEIRNAGHLGSKVNFGYFRRAEGEPLRVVLSGNRHQALELLGLAGQTDGTGIFTMGYAAAFGRGKVIYAGSNPSPHILRLVLEQEGCAPYASPVEELVTTSFFRHRDGSIVLFVVNRNDRPCRIPVRVNTEKLGIHGAMDVTLVTGCAQPANQGISRDTGSIEVAVNPLDVTILRMPPVERGGSTP